jgi:hypothetical protein
MRTSGHVLAKQSELGNDDKRSDREGGGMTTDAWFSDLQKQHRELLGETRLLTGVPELWRRLFAEWVREIEKAGAIASGMRVGSLYEKYGSLRAELVGRSAGDPKWDAFEVSLEDRTEQVARQENTGG